MSPTAAMDSQKPALNSAQPSRHKSPARVSHHSCQRPQRRRSRCPPIHRQSISKARWVGREKWAR